MEEPQETIVEVREEMMVSPTGTHQTTRTAHFLKPIFPISNKPLPISSLPPRFDPKNWPLEVAFHAWRYPTMDWQSWVDKMASRHQSTWEKAGICEAILNSKYQIKRNYDLVLGVGERWCFETKSFIFSWGEATITLEDVMILGCYSVLGSPVFSPLESEELIGLEEHLNNVRKEIARSRAKKACPHQWMKKFMDSGCEFEHEAFLVLWLSRYVFPNAHDSIRRHVFSIAIRLARGTRIALAPAVLASMYRDLSLLKETIVASMQLDNEEEVLAITLYSPFQLVQVWAWERFLELRPKPNVSKIGEPRLAQWHNMNCKVENVRLALDSARESFNWRPYAAPIENWSLPKFYREEEVWLSVGSGLNEELQTFARCLRTTELVGIDCVEQYLPHRVAMQFGMDQDIPGCVARSNASPEIAWSHYSRLIGDVKLYVPSWHFKAYVTTRYLEWWKRSMLGSRCGSKGVVRSSKNSKKSPKSLKGKKEGTNNSAPRVCHLKGGSKKSAGSSKGKKKVNDEPASSGYSLKSSKRSAQILNAKKKGDDEPASPGIHPNCSKESARSSKGKKKGNIVSASPDSHLRSLKKSAQGAEGMDSNNESASAGFPSKSSEKSSESLKRKREEEDNPTIAELLKSNNKLTDIGNRKGNDGGNLLGQGLSLSIVDNGASKNVESLIESVETILKTAAMMGDLETDVEDANRSDTRRLVHETVSIGGNEGEGISYKFDIPGSELENNLAIVEMLKPNDKCDDVGNKVGDDGGNSSGQSQSLPLLILDSGADENVETLTESVENVVQTEVTIGSAETAVEHADGSNTGSPVHDSVNINDKEGKDSSYDFDIPGAELEAHISRLERMVAELKAAWFGHKLSV